MEVRETPEPQEPRRIKRMHEEVVPKEAPQALEATIHKIRRIYYSSRSAQTPRPTEEPLGQEGQGQHPGNRHNRQESKEPLKHPDSREQRGQSGQREAMRRREQHTQSSRVNRGSGNPRRRRDTHTHPGSI